MQDSFVFYRSFFEAISELEDAQKGRMLTIISEYALNDTLPTLSGVEKSIFILIKPQVDANIKRRNNGKNGGRPKQENNQGGTKDKPKHNQRLSKPKPNANVNANVNANADPENPLWFEGNIIKVRWKDFEKWMALTNYSNDYLMKILNSRDKWFSENPDKSANWFMSTSKHLQNLARAD